MATVHDRGRTAHVLIEQRCLQQHPGIGAIDLNTYQAVLGDDAVLDARHCLPTGITDRIDAVAGIAANNAVGDVQSDRTIRGVDLYSAARVVCDGYVIECRSDTAACGRFEKNPATAVRYPTISNYEV